ncbi:unnamed protein product [Rotaria sordida]|uniref:PDZ domain-containing protein n=1 Tax=Rotaria sordida TaxID=392033 RepID=A0A819K005_9BILA|nr:unnamed protein product [Rotaria sordida]
MTSNGLGVKEPRPRLCHLHRWPDFSGYGFNLHSEKSKPGQYIGKVDPNSPAVSAGLREKDRIIEVNSVPIGNENHKQVVQRIKEGVTRNGTKYPEEVILLVLDPDADEYYKSRSILVKSSDPNVEKCETKNPDETNHSDHSPYSSNRNINKTNDSPYSSDRNINKTNDSPYSSNRNISKTNDSPYSSNRNINKTNDSPYSSDRHINKTTDSPIVRQTSQQKKPNESDRDYKHVTDFTRPQVTQTRSVDSPVTSRASNQNYMNSNDHETSTQSAHSTPARNKRTNISQSSSSGNGSGGLVDLQMSAAEYREKLKSQNVRKRDLPKNAHMSMKEKHDLIDRL